MKNILILGVSGFIGTYLARTLMDKNYRIIGYDRVLSELDLHKSIAGDFFREDQFEAILTENNIDTVYHLICTTVPHDSTENIEEEVLQNIIPTLRLLEAMKRAGVMNLVFASSGGTVYGDSLNRMHPTTDPLMPVCSYGAQKAVIEQYIGFYNRKYGMNCKIARISNPYGVLEQDGRTQGIIPLFFEKLKCGQEITVYGETTRDYIYIFDLCNALINFGEYAGDKFILNIGTGNGTGLHELIALLEMVAGKKFTKINEAALRTCDVQCSILDIHETVETLAWKPGTTLIKGLELVWEQMNES